MAVAGTFSGTLTLIGDISCKGITVGVPFVCRPAAMGPAPWVCEKRKRVSRYVTGFVVAGHFSVC